MACADDRILDLLLEQALRLLLGGYIEDVPQLMVHPVHPIGGGHMQSVEEHHCHGHVLDSPGKSWTRHPLMVDGHSDGPGTSSSLGEVNSCGQLHP
jgi:hypothetical protein